MPCRTVVSAGEADLQPVLRIHRLALTARLSPRDIVGAKYFHIRTNEIDSPIGLDPSGPDIPQIFGGSKHLADDISVDYTRVIGEGMFLNAAVLYSRPAALLDGFAGEPLPDWISVTTTLTLRF